MTRATAEIANLFKARDLAAGSNRGELVYPGQPGLVITDDAESVRDGQDRGRTLRQMIWGFPLVLKSKRTGEPLKPMPVNNARTDKLDSFFWRDSFAKRRCLIPVSAYAEAQGPKGAKTRTWIGMPPDGKNAGEFACAGLWRDSAEWGACYSMTMTEANEQTAQVHDRMPVILRQADWQTWMHGEAEEALALCKGWGSQLNIDQTQEPWTR